MIKKRRQYSSEFKAKIALSAIREDEAIPQPAARMGYIPHISIAGNGNSLNKQLICFAEATAQNKENGQTTDNLLRH